MNPFSVVMQNVHKISQNTTSYPDEESISALFVLYAGDVGDYSQSDIVKAIQKESFKAQQYGLAKLHYAVFQLLIKSSTAPATKRDVTSLPSHFLQFQLKNCDSTPVYAAMFSSFVHEALQTQLSRKNYKYYINQFPVYLKAAALQIKYGSSFCTAEESDQLFIFLQGQVIRFLLKEISLLLTSCADYYRQQQQLDACKALLPDLRLSVRQLGYTCRALHMAAKIDDIPDLLENMVRKHGISGQLPMSESQMMARVCGQDAADQQQQQQQFQQLGYQPASGINSSGILTTSASGQQNPQQLSQVQYQQFQQSAPAQQNQPLQSANQQYPQQQQTTGQQYGGQQHQQLPQYSQYPHSQQQQQGQQQTQQFQQQQQPQQQAQQFQPVFQNNNIPQYNTAQRQPPRTNTAPNVNTQYIPYQAHSVPQIQQFQQPGAQQPRQPLVPQQAAFQQYQQQPPQQSRSQTNLLDDLLGF